MKEQDRKLANIEAMYRAPATGEGFSAIVVVSSSKSQAAFWRQRLEAVRGQVIGNSTTVLYVAEEWPGGAGQLLGTLHAWGKACQEVDLGRVLDEGGTVAIYHTAGKGMRLAPLPACEGNCKSAVKLPRMVKVRGEDTPLTILEAVIFQTSIFAPSRRGRVCVFWGDQVFVPSSDVACAASHHGEIFSMERGIPASEEDWNREWRSYGLIIPRKDGAALQREKCSWQDFQQLRATGIVGPAGKTLVARSVGSFSMTAALFRALLLEFEKELFSKKGRLNTDYHLWMPLTSGEEEYEHYGGQPGYWRRLDRFRDRFLQASPSGRLLFGNKDLGRDTLSWDYGQLKLYWKNLLKLLDPTPEGEALRQFYLQGEDLTSREQGDWSMTGSVVANSRIKRGRIERSIVLGVEAGELDVRDSVIINCTAGSLRAEGALAYDLAEPGNLVLHPGQVMAGVCTPDGRRIRIATHLDRDGRDDWDKVLPGNPCSYQDLERLLEG